MSEPKMTPLNFVTTEFRTENTTPYAYRLGHRKDGTLFLQGAYKWFRGDQYGYEWRDIPTVDIEQEE